RTSPSRKTAAQRAEVDQRFMKPLSFDLRTTGRGSPSGKTGSMRPGFHPNGPAFFEFPRPDALFRVDVEVAEIQVAIRVRAFVFQHSFPVFPIGIAPGAECLLLLPAVDADSRIGKGLQSRNRNCGTTNFTRAVSPLTDQLDRPFDLLQLPALEGR